MRTYSTTVWSSCDDVILKFEVWIEDGGVEVDSAVEAVADTLPVGRCFRHRDQSFSFMNTSITMNLVSSSSVAMVTYGTGHTVKPRYARGLFALI